MPSSPGGAVVLTAFVFGLQSEDTMRKSFQQQLSDAIAVIKGMYTVGECCHGGQLWFLRVQGVELALSFHEDMFPQMSGRLREFGLGLSMLTLSAPKSHYMM